MAYASKTYLCFIKSWRVQLAMFTVGESPPISQVNGKKKQKLKLKQKQTNKKANKHTKKNSKLNNGGFNKWLEILAGKISNNR